jgi:RNA polymerase sigma factor (sigma-70 family)
VLQDAYAAIWRKAAQYDASIASPVSWLAMIAHNKAIDRLRSEGIARNVPIEFAAEVSDTGPGASQLAEHAGEARRLDHCLEKLEARRRTLIRTAFFDGATYEELARRTDTPVGTGEELDPPRPDATAHVPGIMTPDFDDNEHDGNGDDIRSAEYVLGTMDPMRARRSLARVARDPSLARMTDAWRGPPLADGRRIHAGLAADAPVARHPPAPGVRCRRTHVHAVVGAPRVLARHGPGRDWRRPLHASSRWSRCRASSLRRCRPRAFRPAASGAPGVHHSPTARDARPSSRPSTTMRARSS